MMNNLDVSILNEYGMTIYLAACRVCYVTYLDTRQPPAAFKSPINYRLVDRLSTFSVRYLVLRISLELRYATGCEPGNLTLIHVDNLWNRKS